MNIKKLNKINKNLYIGITGIILIFIVDMIIPLGVAVGVLYVCCIIPFLRGTKSNILIFTVTSSIIIIIVPILTTNTATTWMAYVNRGISIVAIWIVYYVAIKHKQLDHLTELYTKKLEVKNKELNQFAYIASHDLKEPLNTITGYVEILERGYSKNFDDICNKCIKSIGLATDRMRQLIGSLLEYARIGVTDCDSTIDCNKLLSEIKNDLNSLIKSTQSSLLIDDLPHVKGNEVELRMLFQNLIANGIKFQKNGNIPRIKISYKSIENNYLFSIEDNGIGIGEKNLKDIFIIFKRLHTKKAYEGTGIGLANCQKIVRHHGGEIKVESKPNIGSKFSFTLPIRTF